MANAVSEADAAQSARQHGRLNLYDMPELLPGAQPSANPAQREQFEERCRHLHRTQHKECRAEVRRNAAAAGETAAPMLGELEAMFPNLDPALIRAIRQDSDSAQSALDTLLALSAASAEPGESTEDSFEVPDLPPMEVGVEDHNKFPHLTDGHGWQIAPAAQFERAVLDPEDEEFGSVWCDRAKAAAEIPQTPVKQVVSAWGRKKPQVDREKDKDDDDAFDRKQPLTDYEFRHQVGQNRVKHRAQYGRGRGRRHVGAVGPSRKACADPETESDLSDEEEETG